MYLESGIADLECIWKAESLIWNVFGFTLQDVVREFQEKNRVYLLTPVYSVVITVVITVVKIYLARILVNMVSKHGR